ncbi:hypothetical protein BD410DRAFT_895019 [Rickenella mellea]|uniref:XPG-I domain-containing protein n=1 Tax=Rickenella mellea TaxID=50990 RepID=A0A4Y7QID3_9AGAM|nr:hypothetical protein BD410DRAFT_895019 [Rickenella mellea]
MGVPGLWDILRPAAEQRSLTHLAVTDGFLANPSGRRGLRIGIDASIWFFHAAYGKEGENPELRTLFFRCARLMSTPFLPLFVFDGPKRPKVKRGKRVGGKEHWLQTGMQQIISAFGFEYRMAPGEAEAELAYLNRIGVIDAIMSDDVDNFLFGAVKIIRNPSKTLTGNRGHPIKNAAGKEDGEHTDTFSASAISSHPSISLTTGGLILIGLLRGGDYHTEGLTGCGPLIAHGLARCGFGDTLVHAARTLSRERLELFLAKWREEVRAELRTNARGYLKSKRAKLAEGLGEAFPDVEVLMSYVRPVTSESQSEGEAAGGGGGGGGGEDVLTKYKWDREPDLGRIAEICEWKFEWGVRDIIIKRFRTVIWAPAVLRIMRHAVLDLDAKSSDGREDRGGGGSGQPATPRKKGKEGRLPPPGTPSAMITRYFSSMAIADHRRASSSSNVDEDNEEEERLIVKIHSKRAHASTDGLEEYRLEIAPAQLVRLAESGIKGTRQGTGIEGLLGSDEDDGACDEDDDDDDGDGDGGGKKKRGTKPPPDPESHLRVWMPACMVRAVEPAMVEAFEAGEEAKRAKKAGAAVRKAAKAAGGGVGGGGGGVEKVKVVKKKKVVQEEEEENGEENGEDFSDVFGMTKKKATKRPAKTVKSKSKPGSIVEEPNGEDNNTTQPKSGPSKQQAPTLAIVKVKDKYPFMDPSDSDSDSPVSKSESAPQMSSPSASIASVSPMKTPTKGVGRTASWEASPILSALSRLSANDASPSKGKAMAKAKQGLQPALALAPARAESQPKLRPFPMSFSDFEISDDEKKGQSSTTTTTTAQASNSKGIISGGKFGFTRGKKSRTRSSRTSDSDSASRESALKKSPRKSVKHTSPRSVRVDRREESEESEGEGSRPSSPSPLRLPQRAAYDRREESEEDLRRPVSPSPMRRKARPKATVATKAVPKLVPTANPGCTSIIDLSSDSDDGDLPKTTTIRPLELARMRAKAKAAPNGVSRAAGKTQNALRPANVNVNSLSLDSEVIDLT